MVETIKKYFVDRGFNTISVNVENINVYYTARENKAQIVVLLSMLNGNEFTKEQHENILRQIKERFAVTVYESIQILSLIVTNYSDRVRAFCVSENDAWILDLQSLRIMRYENQSSDFNGLYKDLEKVLYHENPGVNENRAQEEHHSKSNHSMTRRSLLHFGTCNTIIVGINVILFFIMEIFGLRTVFFEKGAIFWPFMKFLNEYYRLITSMFIHSDISHLVNNMLILLFIGDNLERAVGKVKYLIIYFTTGMIAGLVSMRYNMENGELVRSVGASGAIFGVVGAVAFLVLVNRGTLKEISKRQIILFVMLSLYGGLISQGVDNAAHIGGLIAGVIVMAVLYFLQKKRSAS